MNPHDYDLKHLDLKLTPEQFDILLNWWPPQLKERGTKSIVLSAHYKGERYGVVHVTSNNPS